MNPTSEPPVHCSTAATLTLGAGWTLRLHVHRVPIALDLICARCGKGYSLDLDCKGNGALVRLILDTHQHPDPATPQDLEQQIATFDASDPHIKPLPPEQATRLLTAIQELTTKP